jgi:hypothetical protein
VICNACWMRWQNNPRHVILFLDRIIIRFYACCLLDDRFTCGSRECLFCVPSLQRPFSSASHL